MVAAIKSGNAQAAADAAKKLIEQGNALKGVSSSKKDTKAAIDIARDYVGNNSEVLQKIADGNCGALSPEDKMKLGVF